MCGLRDEGTYYCTALVKGSCGLKVCGGMGGSREANRSMTEPKKKKTQKSCYLKVELSKDSSGHLKMDK